MCHRDNPRDPVAAFNRAQVETSSLVPVLTLMHVGSHYRSFCVMQQARRMNITYLWVSSQTKNNLLALLDVTALWRLDSGAGGGFTAASQYVIISSVAAWR